MTSSWAELDPGRRQDDVLGGADGTDFIAGNGGDNLMNGQGGDD